MVLRWGSSTAKRIGRRSLLGLLYGWRKGGLLHALLHALLLWSCWCHHGSSSSWSHVRGRKPALLAVTSTPPPGSVLVGLGGDRRSFWERQLRLPWISLEHMLGHVHDGLSHFEQRGEKDMPLDSKLNRIIYNLIRNPTFYDINHPLQAN